MKLKEAQLKVHKPGVLSTTRPLINRMKVEEKHPREMDIEEVPEFLVHGKEERQINWRVMCPRRRRYKPVVSKTPTVIRLIALIKRIIRHPERNKN